jgi:hypothetical protein
LATSFSIAAFDHRRLRIDSLAKTFARRKLVFQQNRIATSQWGTLVSARGFSRPTPVIRDIEMATRYLTVVALG